VQTELTAFMALGSVAIADMLAFAVNIPAGNHNLDNKPVKIADNSSKDSFDRHLKKIDYLAVHS
jgi:hypothetical protein